MTPSRFSQFQAASFLIVARARNGVIGNRGEIPWRSKADFAHFRHLTMGCALIMGRNTWSSLPGPLPGRRILVITRSPINSQDAQGFTSVEQALDFAITLDGVPGVAFAGGTGIYKAALEIPWLRTAWVTQIDLEPSGDAIMPELAPEWSLSSLTPLSRKQDEPSGTIQKWNR